jgi:hypothetical protein
LLPASLSAVARGVSEGSGDSSTSGTATVNGWRRRSSRLRR